MPITKTVDKTLVNGSEQFVYTIEFSYSGLTEPDQVGEIVDFYPSIIQAGNPIVGPSEVVKSVSSVDVPGGKEVTYNLGTVSNGTSGSFTYFAQFGPGRADGDTFTNTARLLANGVEVDSATAETVTLQLDENFILRKDIQTKTEYRAGDELEVRLFLQNTDDPGAVINNVVISDVLPSGLLPVTTFVPVGNDASTGGYSDPTYDGRTGSWSGNTLNFTLPSYKGSSYVILFKVIIDDTVTPGQTIVNTATWTADGQTRNNATDSITIFEDIVKATFIKRGPQYATVGADINYIVTFRNTGTVNLTDIVWQDVLPDEVDITALSFTTRTNWLDKYSISIITTADPLTEIPVLVDAEGDNRDIDLTTFIPSGARITKIIVRGDTMFTKSGDSILYLLGTVNDTAITGETFTNTSDFVAQSSLGELTGSSSVNTIVDAKSYLELTKSMSPTISLRPLDEVNVTLSAITRNSSVIDPIIIDYLPLGLEYLPGSDYFEYTDYLTGKTYVSTDPDWPPEIPKPTPEIIKNYNGTGRTFVRWDFSGFTVPYLNTLVVKFKAVVSVLPPSTMTNTGYLGNPGDNTFLLPSSAFLDSDDYDNDGIVTENIAKSNSINLTALSSALFKTEKFVKGELDSEFGTLGNTTSGGLGEYKLYVTNSFPSDLKEIQVVDILPYVGDTGVILTGTARGSQYEVLANSVVSAEIVNILGEPVDPNPEIIIEYNLSNDPLRFDQNDQPIGTDPNWSETPPANLSDIRSFRVTTGSNVVLKPYDRLIITIQVMASNLAAIDQIAYNSFAAKGIKITATGDEPLLPTEPNKVGLKIQRGTTSDIGDFVWIDLNGDGIYDDGEPGINGVTVELYDQNKNLIATTVTGDHPVTGEPGYYIFENLLPGDYYVKFIPPSGYVLTVQRADQVNGSKPNPLDGFTDLITLEEGINNFTIDAGVVRDICKEPPIINAKNQCLFVGEVFDPLANVTATDCDGTNIILTSANVINNTVDTTTPGIYEVTYEVTSLINGLVSTKTILVKVCENGPRYQAITDLFESVALEQAALAHILNAEGEKIQKAKELELSEIELLKIEGSVKDMIDSITRLEMVLQGKLEIFESDACGLGCCKDFK